MTTYVSMTSPARPALRFGLVYDFRNPPGSVIETPTLYAQVLDQVVLAEQWGYDVAWFTEHHFVDDGYLPSWVPVAGAVFGRTSRLRVSTDIAILPFYHPLRLAEDVAVLDNLSGGRIELGVGIGYAPHEFDAFGIPVSRRVSLMEEGLDVLRLAWSGERFSYHGRRYDLDGLIVTPRPVQAGGPPLWIAAMTDAGAVRAARYGAHFLPQGSSSVLDTWRGAAPDASSRRVGIIRSWLVTDDRERDWPPIRAAERYRMELYGRFFQEADADWGLGASGAIPQMWAVGTAAEVEVELADSIERYGLTDLACWAAPPGISPESMNGPLERFAREVMPKLRARFDPAVTV
jgi:alkanesulfonate monooxygenase SsuD/methylene tetrahydromethanopterin reductase-like flavin-dependent oxidoreductase (luciferase family)